MKRKPAHLIYILSCFITVIILTINFSGCLIFPDPNLTHPKEYYGEREVGDLVVWFSSGDYCSVTGTTEQGNTKRFLVIPDKIEDSPVITFGNQRLLDFCPPDIQSEVLEKIYIENDPKVFYNRGPGGFHNYNCPNLEKIVYISNWETGYAKVLGCTAYYPLGFCEKYASENPYSTPLNAANVSYYYNHKYAENFGYYWVDDCDYGGKIEFVPEDPERKGYTFGGWYKEAECINKWDFETDTLPEEKTEQNQTKVNGKNITKETVVYQQTILYARWIKQS